MMLFGSTSATSLTPSRTSACGTGMSAEQQASSSAVATTALPVIAPSSVAPLKKRTRTAALPRPLRLPRTNTRAMVGRSAMSGMPPAGVCIDCVRYTSGRSRLASVPAFTVTVDVAVRDGSAAAVAVMVAAPAVIARTTPVALTVAMAGVPLFHATSVLVEPDTVAVSCCVWPGVSVTVDGATATATLAFSAPLSESVKTPVSPAVALVTVITKVPAGNSCSTCAFSPTPLSSSSATLVPVAPDSCTIRYGSNCVLTASMRRAVGAAKVTEYRLTKLPSTSLQPVVASVSVADCPTVSARLVPQGSIRDARISEYAPVSFGLELLALMM